MLLQFLYHAAIKLLQLNGPLNTVPRGTGSGREDGILHVSEEQDKKCTYKVEVRCDRFLALWTLCR